MVRRTLSAVSLMLPWSHVRVGMRVMLSCAAIVNVVPGWSGRRAEGCGAAE